jgi:predicted transcriptional regulator
MRLQPIERFFRGRRGGLDSVFGRLERQVLDVIWAREAPSSVRDVQQAIPEAAYTTVMTTLDRLHRKGVLDRSKSGRAYLYRPRFTCDELRSSLAMDALDNLLGTDASAIRPVVSFFVDAVSTRDAALLDELEALVQKKRRQQGDVK